MDIHEYCEKYVVPELELQLEASRDFCVCPEGGFSEKCEHVAVATVLHGLRKYLDKPYAICRQCGATFSNLNAKDGCCWKPEVYLAQLSAQ